jgi:hypothetical protein
MLVTKFALVVSMAAASMSNNNNIHIYLDVNEKYNTKAECLANANQAIAQVPPGHVWAGYRVNRWEREYYWCDAVQVEDFKPAKKAKKQ